jgi:hypothetical protein
MIAYKQFWLSNIWAPPPLLIHKILNDLTVGRKEFKPPEWETFKP